MEETQQQSVKFAQEPNTITLFDYGTTDDQLCYIAMEYLTGMDLSAVVQQGVPMDLKRVWKVLVQSCRSLAEAHRLGLVHRDLKPENIFLCQRPEGEFIKVLDFGVSKAISSFGDAGPASTLPSPKTMFVAFSKFFRPLLMSLRLVWMPSK